MERVEALRVEDGARLLLKQPVVAQQCGCARKRGVLGLAVFRQPVPHAPDCFGWVAGVNFDVLAADIRERSIITMRFGLQYQSALAAVASSAQEPCPKVNA